jgi:hypothetical protein
MNRNDGRKDALADRRRPRHGKASSVNQDINVLALVKGAERYIFLYDDANRAEALRVLGRFASNPELSFTWYDAAVLSQKIRQTAQQQAQEQAHRAQPRFTLPLASEEG